MRPIEMRICLFRSEEDRERSERAMHFLLHALVCIDREYLLLHPETPPLYDSGVRYWMARAGKPDWQDVAETLARRLGDCKDLACWRVAELRNAGIWARPYIRYAVRIVRRGIFKPPLRLSVYHVLVQMPDGELEDPSAILGMRGDGTQSPYIPEGATAQDGPRFGWSWP